MVIFRNLLAFFLGHACFSAFRDNNERHGNIDYNEDECVDEFEYVQV